MKKEDKIKKQNKNKNIKRSKGGYIINKNGKPLILSNTKEYNRHLYKPFI